LKPVRCGAVW